ncbi:hypothetical protein Tco_1231669, partial [Tanacetum coccineum]
YSFPYHRHIYTPSFKALNMAALYILDKLSEAAGYSLLEDKMKGEHNEGSAVDS